MPLVQERVGEDPGVLISKATPWQERNERSIH